MSPTQVKPAQSPQDDGRKLTGGMVLAMLLAFFAVIIGVNGTMAYLAKKTMPGTVIGSSYESSQTFNKVVIAKANEQAARHWAVEASVSRNEKGQGALAVQFKDAEGKVLSNLDVALKLEHPMNTGKDMSLTAREVAPGTYLADTETLEAGARDLIITAKRGEDVLYTSKNRISIQ